MTMMKMKRQGRRREKKMKEEDNDDKKKNLEDDEGPFLGNEHQDVNKADLLFCR